MGFHAAFLGGAMGWYAYFAFHAAFLGGGMGLHAPFLRTFCRLIHLMNPSFGCF
jgi:hypothetical protein